MTVSERQRERQRERENIEQNITHRVSVSSLRPVYTYITRTHISTSWTRSVENTVLLL